MGEEEDQQEEQTTGEPKDERHYKGKAKAYVEAHTDAQEALEKAVKDKGPWVDGGLIAHVVDIWTNIMKVLEKVDIADINLVDTIPDLPIKNFGSFAKDIIDVAEYEKIKPLLKVIAEMSSHYVNAQTKSQIAGHLTIAYFVCGGKLPLDKFYVARGDYYNVEDTGDPKGRVTTVADRPPVPISKEEVQDLKARMRGWAKDARQFRMNTATAQAMGGQAYHGIPVEIDDTLMDGQVVYDSEEE